MQQSMEDTLLAYSNGSRGEVAYPMLRATCPYNGSNSGNTCPIVDLIQSTLAPIMDLICLSLSRTGSVPDAPRSSLARCGNKQNAFFTSDFTY